jgi:hypothetical protein
MGDNNSSRSDPCESGLLEVWTEENPLDCLQQFRRGLVEDRRQEYMLLLRLHLEDLTQEVVAAVVKVSQVCYTKGIQWKTLDVWLPADNNQNRFLHLILSEAQRLRQFKEVDLKGLCSRAALTNEIAKELRAMMFSEQGIERLKLTSMRLLPGVLTALSEGLRANRVVELGLYAIPFMEREVMVDGEINEYNGEGRDGEIAYFIEGLRQNTSLKDLSLRGNNLLDETLSRVILALVGHPILQELYLNQNEGLDQTTGALCSLFGSDSCMVSELSFGAQSSPLRKINVGPLAQAIGRYAGCLQILDLSNNRLDNHDLVTLLDAASICRTLVTLDLSGNNIGNLNLLDEIMQTHNPAYISRLTRLSLHRNPLGDDDKEALAKLVKDHPELQSFGFDEDEKSLLITPAIQYMLDLNRSERVLMTNPSTTLSVGATVLERANNRFKYETDSDLRTASVIYGLLRQWPAFVARSPNE